MIRAQVKGVSCNDIPDIQSYCPPDARVFGHQLDIYVGPRDARGEEVFYLTVCSPAWLERRVSEEGGFLFCRATIVVNTWDWAAITQNIERIFNRIHGESWAEVGNKLNLFAGWEFSDW